MLQHLLLIVTGLISATAIASAGAESVFAAEAQKDIAAAAEAIALVEDRAAARPATAEEQQEPSYQVDASTPALQIYKIEADAATTQLPAEEAEPEFLTVHQLSEGTQEKNEQPEAIAHDAQSDAQASTDTVPSTPAVHALQPAASPVASAQPQTYLEAPAGYVQLSNGVYVPGEWVRRNSRTIQDRLARNASTGAGSEVVAPETNPVSAPLVIAGSRTTAAALSQPNFQIPAFASTDFPAYPLARVAPTTSFYGMRGSRLHEGIDLAVPVGTPVLAALPGRVSFVGWQDGYGLTVILEHTNGTTQTLYAHLSRALVAVGTQVNQGQAIALSGNTGRSTGPHLHYEIRERLASGGWRAINLNSIFQFSRRIREQGLQVAQAAPSQSQSAIMRVAVVVDASALAIAGSHGLILRGTAGELLGTLSQMKSFSVSRLGGELLVGDQRLPQLFFAEPAQPGGLVAVNGRWYRGRVLVGVRPTGLIAVNWVGMEDYLMSVVGSEMIPSWPLHALKAQAIAARSYALAHRLRPADRNWFDVLSTPRHQAYRGVEAETRATNQAVALTRGIILAPTPAFMRQRRVHVVGGVVEALYASTQEIVDDVHNGFGLSQWGAASLARQGSSYLQILSYYYPETMLLRAY